MFSLLVLPPAFVRIRHYGLLKICEDKGWQVGICPHCKYRMQILEIIEPARAPPQASVFARTANL